MKGSSLNPIPIDSEGEVDDMEIKVEEARNKIILQKAIMTKDPIQLCLASIKTTIKGDIKRKTMVLNRAIIKYFEKQAQINPSSQHFHPQPQPDYTEDNAIVPTQFLVYGVDFLSTGKVKEIFTLINTRIDEIIWINSSLCKMIYHSQQDAKTALETLVADKNALKIKLDQNSDRLPQGWFKLNKQYQIYGLTRQFSMRYSTEEDNNLTKESNQKYQVFSQVEGAILPHLLELFSAKEVFHQVVLSIEREKNEHIRRGNNRDRMRMEGRQSYRDRTRQRNHRGFSRQPMNGYDRRERFDRRNDDREVRRIVHYQREPVDWRNRRQHQNGRLGSANRGNKFYDNNSIGSADNLSFQFRPQQSRVQSDFDQNIEFNLNTSIAMKKPSNNESFLNISNMTIGLNNSFLNKSRDVGQGKADMSFILNQSIVKQSKPDMSFVLNQSVRNSQKADMSFAFNNLVEPQEQQEDVSIVIDENKKKEKEVEEQDYSVILGIGNEVSPIHPALMDTDIPFKDQTPKNGSFKPQAVANSSQNQTKKRSNKWMDSDDSGY